MAKPFANNATLPNGQAVGYALIVRGNHFGCRFKNPDGKLIEKQTGETTISDAHTKAAKIINEHYLPVMPVSVTCTWQQAEEELSKSTLRPDTLNDYRKAIKRFLEIVPKSKTPSDVDEETASRFVRLLEQSTYTKTKNGKGATYKRGANTVRSYIRKLSSLWNLHFREYGYVKTNPWLNVRKPKKTDHDTIVPNEVAFAKFFAWVKETYPTWTILHALLEVKALSGCRTLDLSQLRSSQLRDGAIKWEANQTKTHKSRTVPLPAELFAKLETIKGKTYLWENYFEQANEFRRGCAKMSFSIKALRSGIGNIFQEFNEAHPEMKVNAHDLRRRAITLTALATQNMDLTAQAIGIDPATARKHYLDAQIAFNADETMRKMAGILLPSNATGWTGESKS